MQKRKLLYLISALFLLSLAVFFFIGLSKNPNIQTTYSLPISLSFLGLTVLFLWAFTGALGVPGSSIGIIAFGAVASGFGSLALLIVIVYIAVVLGDLTAYGLAAFFSERFREKMRRLKFFRDNEEKAREKLKQYEFMIVFLTRFVFTGLCQVTSYVSGFERVSRRKFVLAVLTGEALFAAIYVMIGFFVGEIFNTLINTVNYLVVFLILAALLVYMIRYFLRKRRL